MPAGNVVVYLSPDDFKSDFQFIGIHGSAGFTDSGDSPIAAMSDLELQGCLAVALDGAEWRAKDGEMSTHMPWLLTLLMAGSSQAASTAPAADDITITGVRATPEAIRQHATDFVTATGIALSDLPAARWIDPVCPRAFGIADPYARIVEAKLRSIAADAGIAVAKEKCTPNIAITFALDAGEFVQAIVAKSPKRLAEVPVAQVAALKNGAAPIRWWYSTEPRDKDGSPPVPGPPPWSLGTGEGGRSSIPDRDGITFVNHYNSSLVGTETVRALRTATVVIDMKRTQGLPLSSVASYAAMVALAEMRPSVAGGAGSILGLFDGGELARGPTTWDIAFLRAVYRLPLDRRAEQQRRMLIRDLVAMP